MRLDHAHRDRTGPRARVLDIGHRAGVVRARTLRTMPSTALEQWRTERSARLDELLDAHRAIDPRTGRGRRIGTEQLNLVLAVKLAAEWQGFCRELHTVAADHFADQVAEANGPVAGGIVRALLTRKRRLDTGNADPSALAEDFGRFGIHNLWNRLKERDHRTAGRQHHLQRLMTARNAIAHDDEEKYVTLRDAGVKRIDLRTVRTWRHACDGLAGTLDAFVADHLTGVLDTGQPGQRVWP